MVEGTREKKMTERISEIDSVFQVERHWD